MGAMGIYPSYVAGIVVVPGRQDVAQNVRLGDRLTTEREPDNPYDANAVRLYHDGGEIGYVPARHAVWVAEILDRGGPLTITVAAIKHSGDARLPDIYLDTEIRTDEDA